jgi:hypothetical protein
MVCELINSKKIAVKTYKKCISRGKCMEPEPLLRKQRKGRS